MSGGSTRTNPPRVRGVPGEWHWQPEMSGGKKGQVVPLFDKGLKMFEIAQFSVFTPDVKKGGAHHFRFFCGCWQAMGLGGMHIAGRTWEWSPTWWEIIGVGGFAPSVANRRAYAGWVHGTASRPKPKTPSKPAA